MRMALGIDPVQVQIPAMKCSVCRQLILDAKKEKDIRESRTFGAVKYASCSCCNQAVGKPWTHGYKCRWTRWSKKCPDK